MMKRDNKYEAEGGGLDAKFESMISRSQVRWSRSKDEVWRVLESHVDNAVTGQVVRLQWLRYAVAASLILLLGAGVFAALFSRHVEAGSGSSLWVALPDGSTVQMEPGSLMQYRPLVWFVWRDVRFEGQALFRVEAGRKFRVLSSKGTTMVLGTQFWVDTRRDGYEVTCVSGRVSVAETFSDSRVVLNGGQRASLNVEGQLEVSDVMPESSLPDVIPGTIQENEIDDASQVVETPDIIPTQKQSDFVPLTPQQENNRMVREVITPEPEGTKEISPASNAPMDERLMNQLMEDASNKPNDNAPQVEEAPVKSPSAKSEDAFKASLRPEQVKLLEDATQSREQRRKAFLESLSPVQRELLEQQNRERQRESLSEPKRSDVATPDRESTREQVKEQVRQGAAEDAKQSVSDDKQGRSQQRQGSDNNQKGR